MVGFGFQADDKAAKPAQIVAADPSIPLTDLQLLITPLTQSELVTEANSWQNLLQSSVVGVIFTLGELGTWLPGKDESLLSTMLYYLRFSGYWAVVMLLLIMSQVRSARWTKAILRRLEII